MLRGFLFLRDSLFRRNLSKKNYKNHNLSELIWIELQKMNI
ncbi:hypothetical protein LEP1GSC021_3732 [Leptospira noguchii str. 1993005606]|uniref:Uncharacterized protein n=2 Tax=Leptospira noguchii TaxID=28182 RepID=M6UGV6_9LEPT|nr:hypothetical protein LEP1GSC072_3311 [Leptospira noguchii str. Bonito]EMN00353.1 hypothetical protein LEP1GSC035_3104 [Leptospira noguchii str. 2007001578]EMO40334.1 hypothetical protein LEP1GSC186_3991 [Leptospira noguchii serovar Autumnalis str. ZUN142]EMS85903.1 hypothetical protein LEP1GSC074_3791 [Leptospira noguchii str. Hook]EMS89235.1 hypothetical protein LEP1GSC073_1934 [Leptospira noguchii str. Cascata]EPE85640.1 hypothetical protein LEP1GSC021_3732 [Leptospira noguchii str. 19930